MDTDPFLKRPLVLIDCVPWAPEYPPQHPLRNVVSWYGKALNREVGMGFHGIKVEDLESELNLDEIGGLIISGSPRDAWGDDPVNAVLMGTLLECRRKGLPVLGVCYGHQIMARAFGGRVAPHPDGLQLGNVRVRFSDESKRCPVLQGLDSEETLICGHADTVHELPPGARLLADSSRTSVHAFQLDETLFGVQFHPEFTPEILRFLWEIRIPVWQARVRFDIDSTLKNLTDAPKSVVVLQDFARFCEERL